MNKVKELCIRKGIVQKELASMVGVSQPTVSDWFNNKKDPSGVRLEKLSAILGVGRAVILGLDEVPVNVTREGPIEIVRFTDTKTEGREEKLAALYKALQKMTDEKLDKVRSIIELVE